MAQVLVKIVLTVVILAVPVWAVVRLWRRDIDVRRLLRLDKVLTEKVDDAVSWIPSRDPGAVYQDDQIVGRVEGHHIDEATRVVVFDEINHSTLDMGRPIVFRAYELRIHSIETWTDFSTGAPQKGRILTTVKAEIVGRR